jgi:hypothetical protein
MTSFQSPILRTDFKKVILEADLGAGIVSRLAPRIIAYVLDRLFCPGKADLP